MSESPNVGGVGLGDTALEDAKAFNKGKGRVLAAMIASLVAAMVFMGWYLSQDQSDPYGELGKQVNGLKSQYFDGFWVCALPGQKVSELKNDADLRDALHQRGSAGERYATHLRGKCSASLRELSTRLRALPPSDEAAPFVKGMADAATKLSVGMESYAAHLDNLDGAYDRAAAEPELETPVRGWFEFRTAHVEFNRFVKDKLER